MKTVQSLTLLAGIVLALPAMAQDPAGKGEITRAQFMERSEKLFKMQDQDGDGTISIAEREAVLEKAKAMMQKMGKEAGPLGGVKPRQEITRAQFMERQEKIFNRLDTDGDGKVSEAERQAVRDRVQQLKKGG